MLHRSQSKIQIILVGFKMKGNSVSCNQTGKRRLSFDSKAEDANMRTHTFENIHNYLSVMKTRQDLFDNFVETVKDDINNKRAVWSLDEDNACLNSKQRTYAKLHGFMLGQFLKRLNKFQKYSDTSISRICQEFCKEERNEEIVSHYVKKHIQSLEKMKRRMKHMIDVADKYSEREFVTRVKNESNFDHNLSASMKDLKDRRKVVKFMNLSYIQSYSPSISPLYPLEIVAAPSFKMTTDYSEFEPILKVKSMSTMKSLSDYLCVLTKTYLRSI